MTKPNWKRYEEHILDKIKEWAGPDAKIEFDKRLPGKFSGRTRQIDILVTGDFAGHVQTGLTAAIDCKCYGKKIDVTHAEKFVGLIEDVQTDLGILITNKGWSKTAEERLPRGMSLREVKEEAPAMAMALIDHLPEFTYYVEWGEDYYSGEFWEIEPSGQMGAMIRYNYVERESRYPVDHPDDVEWLDEQVASDTLDKLDWATDHERRHAGGIVLRHYLGREPTDEELDDFFLEIASGWKDGQLWSVDLEVIRKKTGLWANITAGRSS